MDKNIKRILIKIAAILEEGEEKYYSELVNNVLTGNQDGLLDFLVSNELWGGAGSIADQALLDKKYLREKLEKLLVELGEIQVRINKVNTRTTMWLEAFCKQ